MRSKIARWGNSAALRLSKPMIDTLSLSIGSDVEIEVRRGQLVVSPAQPNDPTIFELLDDSPEGSLDLTDEDRAWLNSPPVGKEI